MAIFAAFRSAPLYAVVKMPRLLRERYAAIGISLFVAAYCCCHVDARRHAYAASAMLSARRDKMEMMRCARGVHAESTYARTMI